VAKTKIQVRELQVWADRFLASAEYRLNLKERILAGEGQLKDLDLLADLGDQMTGTTICVLSDSCAAAVVPAIRKFRGEFEAYIRDGRRAASA